MSSGVVRSTAEAGQRRTASRDNVAVLAATRRRPRHRRSVEGAGAVTLEGPRRGARNAHRVVALANRMRFTGTGKEVSVERCRAIGSAHPNLVSASYWIAAGRRSGVGQERGSICPQKGGWPVRGAMWGSWPRGAITAVDTCANGRRVSGSSLRPRGAVVACGFCRNSVRGELPRRNSCGKRAKQWYETRQLVLLPVARISPPVWLSRLPPSSFLRNALASTDSRFAVAWLFVARS